MTEPETVEGRNLVRWLDRALGDQADRDLVRRSVAEIERQARLRSPDPSHQLYCGDSGDVSCTCGAYQDGRTDMTAHIVEIAR